MNFEAAQLHAQLISETRRRIFDESIPRIKKCLDLLNEDEVWRRPNQHSNSVGNLTLHVCGNARQWIVSGLGKKRDIRKRQEEFDELGPIPKADLIRMLDFLIIELDSVLEKVDVPLLMGLHKVQAYEESGVSILIHVIEHFSYHTGQITYFVKALKDVDTGYYAEDNLDQTQ
jgi:uncharacterized damage-inducible protein DinB